MTGFFKNLSIRSRFVLPIAGMAIAFAAFIMLFFPARQRAVDEKGLENKALHGKKAMVKGKIKSVQRVEMPALLGGSLLGGEPPALVVQSDDARVRVGSTRTADATHSPPAAMNRRAA